MTLGLLRIGMAGGGGAEPVWRQMSRHTRWSGKSEISSSRGLRLRKQLAPSARSCPGSAIWSRYPQQRGKQRVGMIARCQATDADLDAGRVSLANGLGDHPRNGLVALVEQAGQKESGRASGRERVGGYGARRGGSG